MVGRIMPNFIEIRQGDSFTIPLQFKNKEGFIDISGARVNLYVKDNESGKIVLSKSGNIDDGVLGKASITLIPEDSKNMAVDGDYSTNIQITFAQGEVHTIYPSDISKTASFIISPTIKE